MSDFSYYSDNVCPTEYQDWDLYRPVDKSTRENFANSLNKRYAKYHELKKLECSLVCELAYWTTGREFGEENEYAPTQAASNCASTCSTQLATFDCNWINDGTFKPYTGGSAKGKKFKRGCQWGYPVTESSLIPGGYWQKPETTYCEIHRALSSLETKIQALQVACDLLVTEIEYEMSQRENIVELRESKGITDRHLSFIYADREEAMMLVAPDSDLVVHTEEEEEAQRKLWMWVAGLGALIAFGGAGIWQIRRKERGE